MAEFIFDLQRFDDGGAGNSGASSNGTAGTSSSQGGGGTSTGGSGWETRIRKEGEIIFPMFMSSAEADAFGEYAYDVFLQAIADGTVSYYDIQDGIVDSFDFSRLLSGSTILDNDVYDVVNLVDTNVGNIIEYYTYNTGDLLSIVFDTGAILAFDIDTVSPWFNFANGESMVYSARQGQWLTGNEAVTEFTFWNTAVKDYGTNAAVDNFYVTQNTNTALFDVTSADNILLYDVASSDVLYEVADSYGVIDGVSLDMDDKVDDENIMIYFPSGGALNVESDDVFSPNFYFADGTSYYYNRHLEEWRPVAYKEADWADYLTYEQLNAVYEAYEEAAAKAVFEEALYDAGYDVVFEADNTVAADGSYYTNFPSSIFTNNYIYDAGYEDTINFYDALAANVADMSVDDDVITFTFNTGKITTVQFDYNFSPIFQFADTFQIGYDWYTETWGNAYYSNPLVEENLAISRSNNSLIYQADSSDTIYFTDAVVDNITSAITGTKYINLYFDTGAVVNVRYTDTETPTFVFADGSQYLYDSEDEVWVSYSADTASDLWGDSTDTVDGILGDGEIVAGATLSDLVAAPVDNAAVSFGADSAFDINAAGGFVAANTAANSEQKDA